MRNHLLTVIARPTLNCNATCDYCSAAICSKRKWTLDDFKRVIDQICLSERYRLRKINWIWHGGEPMLMKPDFYLQSYEYIRQKGYDVIFSMQTNLLLYSEKWHEVIETVLGGVIGTSYDYGRTRNIHGNSDIYHKVFMKRFAQLHDDGFLTGVVTVLTDDNIDQAYQLYDLSRAYESYYGYGFDIKYNYVYTEGRAKDTGIQTLDKAKYKSFLLSLVDRIYEDNPTFNISPINHFIKNMKDKGLAGCPFKSNCASGVLSVDEDGHVYTCSSFANTQDRNYQYGNIFNHTLYCDDGNQTLHHEINFFDRIHTSTAYQAMHKRKVRLNIDCIKCPHLNECQGGCGYQSVLERGDLYAKPDYCDVWFDVISKIKDMKERYHELC